MYAGHPLRRGIGLLLLLILAYRSLSLPLLGALPLASGAIAGLATCTALFGEVFVNLGIVSGDGGGWFLVQMGIRFIRTQLGR